MKRNPGVSIYVSGGGTEAGIDELVKDKEDISMASRTLNPDEIKLFAEKYGSLGISYLIAKDAVSIYLNKNNPVKSFTLEELEGIFTCRINNWKELGGPDNEIRTVIRPPNSGTHLYFRQHVLDNKEYCKEARIAPTNSSAMEEVEKDVYSIGYGGIHFKDGISHAEVNGIKATEENIRKDIYPVSRYLYFYTLDTPRGEVKRFIDWILSPEGQNVVEDAGYISIWQFGD